MLHRVLEKKEGLQRETIFGLDVENPWFVTAFVLIWLALIAVLIRLGRIALPAMLLVAVIATVLVLPFFCILTC